MILRSGHYISEWNLGRNSSAYCLKCGEEFQTPCGRASQTWVFLKACKGNWKGEIADVKRDFERAKKRRERLRRWKAFDLALEKRKG